jgi:hypothetical protein
MQRLDNRKSKPIDLKMARNDNLTIGLKTVETAVIGFKIAQNAAKVVNVEFVSYQTKIFADLLWLS